jgi:hypothetical protein
MGLHNTAHYLKSKGRGRDTELVHMSKREIKGLQDLALAHGGSLTVNPETGLVEAGFLEQILPVVAAAGLTYLTAGAAAPAIAGALGSAGMGAAAATTAGGILAGAGSGALISGGMAAAQGKDVGNAALMGGLGGAISGGLGAYDAAPNLLNAGASAPVPTEGLTNIASNTAITPDMASGLTSADTTQLNQLVAQNSSMVPQNTPLAQMSPEQFAAAGSSRFGAPVGAPDLTTGMGSPSAATLQNAAGAAKTLNAPSSYYAGLQPDQYVQKAAIQALPAAGLLEDKPQQMGPEEEESKLIGLSPNFRPYTPTQPNPYYRAQYPTYAAEGGIMSSYQSGGPVERMSQMNTAINPQGGLYPQGMIDKTQYAIPTQRPTSMEVLDAGAQRTFASGGIASYAPGGMAQQAYLPKGDAGRFVDSDPNTRGLSAFDAAQYRLKKLGARSGIKMAEMPKTGIKGLGGDFSDAAARGGVAHLGDYSDGGRLLKGPGDGVSDNIPATIGGKQPARLADGEFVVPARIVSELGNGSTEAGAKRLYAMMDRVQKARKKTIGKGKIAKDSKSSKYLPA